MVEIRGEKKKLSWHYDFLFKDDGEETMDGWTYPDWLDLRRDDKEATNKNKPV